MKLNSIGGDAIQVQIDGEDYSVADIIHKELLNVKHVKFAGVAPPHPLIKTLSIQVHTDGSSGAEANELLKEAVTNAQAKMEELMDVTKKIFPDAIKLTRVRAPAATDLRDVPQTVSEAPRTSDVSENKAEVSSDQSTEPTVETHETS
jgi:DNA-directed RNA polymerase subunit L